MPTRPFNRATQWIASLGIACLGLILAGAGAVSQGTTKQGLAWDETGTGEAVVLIHAFSVDRRMWDAQVEVLRPHYRVLRYDLRGHGTSVGATEPFSAVEDLAALLEERGIARAALVGLSNGARIAVDFALTHPNRVSRLVLAGPGLSGYVPKEKMDWMQPVFAAARAGDAEKAANLWAETPLMAIPGHPEGAATLRKLVLANAGLWKLTSNPEKPMTPPAIGRLGEIKAPVLVILGERDLPDSHAVADLLIANVPGSRKVVIPGAGHVVGLAAPTAFNDALMGFLRASALSRGKDVSAGSRSGLQFFSGPCTLSS